MTCILDRMGDFSGLVKADVIRTVVSACRSFKNVKKFPSRILKCEAPMADIRATNEIFDDLISGTMSRGLVPTLERP